MASPKKTKTPNRLSEFRAKAKFSQGQLADKLKCRQSTISNWEVGIRRMPPEAAQEIIKIFAKAGVQCSLDEIYSAFPDQSQKAA